MFFVHLLWWSCSLYISYDGHVLCTSPLMVIEFLCNIECLAEFTRSIICGIVSLIWILSVFRNDKASLFFKCSVVVCKVAEIADSRPCVFSTKDFMGFFSAFSTWTSLLWKIQVGICRCIVHFWMRLDVSYLTLIVIDEVEVAFNIQRLTVTVTTSPPVSSLDDSAVVTLQRLIMTVTTSPPVSSLDDSAVVTLQRLIMTVTTSPPVSSLDGSAVVTLQRLIVTVTTSPPVSSLDDSAVVTLQRLILTVTTSPPVSSLDDSAVVTLQRLIMTVTTSSPVSSDDCAMSA